mmetsp:Transcript_46632/g.77116  ORF Transcript_46632/g.77116 Transcript_46632/m.77116 type:complete len:448 (+) Transcript_46632:2-1345(+)
MDAPPLPSRKQALQTSDAIMSLLHARRARSHTWCVLSLVVLVLTPVIFGRRSTTAADKKDCPKRISSSCSNTDVHVRTAFSAFGLQLFATLCADTPHGNVVLSPLVVAGALTLAAAGATPGGTTLTELLGVLGLRSHTEFAALSSQLLSGKGAAVHAANGIFTKSAVKPEYAAVVKSVHAAATSELGSSFEPINAWVSDKTEGRVTNMLEGPPDPLLTAVLVSAVTFKGSWAARFDPAATAPAHFSSVDGKHLRAHFMRRTGSMAASARVESLAGAAVLRLDYGEHSSSGSDSDYCALLVLPRDEGRTALAKTLEALTRASPLELLSRLRTQTVKLALPKLKASYGTASIKAALHSLGIEAAFDGRNGFLVMSDDPEVHIGDVVTKATLELDEEGTEAAAAAAVKVMTRSMPLPPFELTFNRPFLMAIIHTPSGAPLFLAQLHAPVA